MRNSVLLNLLLCIRLSALYSSHKFLNPFHLCLSVCNMYVLGVYAHLHVYVIHMYYACVYLCMLTCVCVCEYTYVCMGRVEVKVKCFLLPELTALRYQLV